MLFFGCWNEAGHTLRRASGMTVHQGNNPEGCPFDANQLDGIFAPRLPQGREDDTVAALTHVHGWTVLAMWDRSVDKRFASNAAFLEPGIWSESAMWWKAKREYPAQTHRMAAFRLWADRESARMLAGMESGQRAKPLTDPVRIQRSSCMVATLADGREVRVTVTADEGTAFVVTDSTGATWTEEQKP